MANEKIKGIFMGILQWKQDYRFLIRDEHFLNMLANVIKDAIKVIKEIAIKDFSESQTRKIQLGTQFRIIDERLALEMVDYEFDLGLWFSGEFAVQLNQKVDDAYEQFRQLSISREKKYVKHAVIENSLQAGKEVIFCIGSLAGGVITVAGKFVLVPVQKSIFGWIVKKKEKVIEAFRKATRVQEEAAWALFRTTKKSKHLWAAFNRQLDNDLAVSDIWTTKDRLERAYDAGVKAFGEIAKAEGVKRIAIDEIDTFVTAKVTPGLFDPSGEKYVMQILKLSDLPDNCLFGIYNKDTDTLLDFVPFGITNALNATAFSYGVCDNLNQLHALYYLQDPNHWQEIKGMLVMCLTSRINRLISDKKNKFRVVYNKDDYAKASASTRTATFEKQLSDVINELHSLFF